MNCLRRLLRGLAEENVNPIEGYGTASDNRTGCHRTPENIGARKLPNSEERGKDRYQDADAGYPKGEAPNHLRIQEASLFPALRVFQVKFQLCNANC